MGHRGLQPLCHRDPPGPDADRGEVVAVLGAWRLLAGGSRCGICIRMVIVVAIGDKHENDADDDEQRPADVIM